MADNDDPTNGMLDKINVDKILQSDEVSKFNEELENFAGSAEDASKKLEEFVKLMEEAFSKDLEKALEQLKDAKKDQEKLKKVNKKVQDSLGKFATDMTDVLQKKMKKMSGNDKLTDNVTAALNNITKNINKKITPMEAMGGAPANPLVPNLKNAAKVGEKDGRAYGHSLLNGVSHFTASIATMLLGGTDLYTELVKGFPDAALLYRREMKKNLYLTDGLTNKTSMLIDEYDTLADTVKITGFGLKESQKAMTMMVTRGFKNAKIMRQIATSSLNTAQMMGLSASESLVMTELFADWNQHFGLSAHQLAGIGFGMKDISRTSGLTGQNLVSAVKSSEHFLEIMRKTGQLTTSSAQNLASMSASLQKRGVLNDANSLMSNLTSPTKILTGQGGAEGAIMAGSAARAGLTKELFSGTINNSRKDMGKFFGAFQEDLERMYNVDFKNLDKLDPQMKAIINASLEAQGMQTLDTYKRIFDGVEEATKPLSKTIEGYNSETDRLSATLKKATGQEKALIEEELLSIKTKKQAATISASASAAQDILDIVSKSGPNYKQGIADSVAGGKISNTLENLSDMMMSSGRGDLADQIKAGNQDAILKATALSSSQALKDLGGGDMTAEIMKAIDSNDSKAIEKSLDEVSKRIAMLDKNRKLENTSPFDALMGTINELNATLVEYISKPLNKFLEIIPKEGLAAIYLGLMAVSVGLAALGTILTGALVVKGTGDLLPWLFPNLTHNVSSLKALVTGMGEKVGVTNKSINGLFTNLQNKIWGTADVVQEMSMGGKTLVPGNKGIMDKIFDFVNRPIKPTNILRSSFERLTSVFSGMGNSLTFVKNSFQNVFGELFTAAKSFIGTSGGLKKATEEVVFAGKTFKNVKDVVPATGIMKRISDFWKSMPSLFDTVGDASKGILPKKGLWTSFKGIFTGEKGLVGVIDEGVAGIAGGINRSFKGVSNVAKKSSLVKFGGPITAAISGVIGAFDGFYSTADTFGKVIKSSNSNVKELTASMYVSSTAANAIWGAIDGYFLFGLGSMLLWVTGLEGTFKKLITFVTHTLVTTAESFWNGLSAGFSWWAPYFTSTWDKIKKQFSGIAKSFIDIWNKIGKAFGLEQAADMEEIFIQIWNILKPIADIVGRIVGFGLGALFEGLFEILSFGISIIQGVVNAISGFITAAIGVGQFIVGLVQLILSPIGALVSGVMAFSDAMSSGQGIPKALYAFAEAAITYLGVAFGNIFGGLGKIVGGLSEAVIGFFKPIISWIGDFFAVGDMFEAWAPNWMKKTFKSIYSWFEWLYDVLVGHSIIPDLINAVIGWFAKLPFNIMKGLFNLGMGILSYILSIPGKIAGGLLQIGSAFVETVKNIPSMMMKGLAAIGEATYNASPDWLKSIFDQISAIGKKFNEYIIEPFTNFVSTIISGKIFTVLNDSISGFCKNLFERMSSALMDAWNWFRGNSKKPINETVQNIQKESLENKLSGGKTVDEKINTLMNERKKTLESSTKHEEFNKSVTRDQGGYLWNDSRTQDIINNNNKMIETNKLTVKTIDEKLDALKSTEKTQKIDSVNIEDTSDATRKLTKEATEKHSIYTHDTHVEKLLNNMEKENEEWSDEGSFDGGGDFGEPQTPKTVVDKTSQWTDEGAMTGGGDFGPQTKQEHKSEFWQSHINDPKYKGAFGRGKLDRDAEKYALDKVLKDVPFVNGKKVVQNQPQRDFPFDPWGGEGAMTGGGDFGEPKVSPVHQKFMDEFIEKHGKEARYAPKFARDSGKLEKDAKRHATLMEQMPDAVAEATKAIEAQKYEVPETMPSNRARFLTKQAAIEKVVPKTPYAEDTVPAATPKNMHYIKRLKRIGIYEPAVAPEQKVVEPPVQKATPNYKEVMSDRQMWDINKFGAYKDEYAKDPRASAAMKGLGMDKMDEKTWKSIPTQFKSFTEGYAGNRAALLDKIQKDPNKAKEKGMFGGASLNDQLEQMDTKKKNWDSMMGFYNNKTAFKEGNPVHDIIKNSLVTPVPGEVPVTNPNWLPLSMKPAFTQPVKKNKKIGPSDVPSKRLQDKGLIPEGAMMEPSNKLVVPQPTLPETTFLSDTLISAEEERSKMMASKAAVTKMPETDTYEQALKQRNDQNSSQENKGGKGDIRDLLSVNEEQVAHLVGIEEGINELIEIFTSRSSGNAGGKNVSTASNIVPTSSPDFNRWQFGSPSQNPNKDIITTGV